MAHETYGVQSKFTTIVCNESLETTTETSFIEANNVAEPLNGDYKVVCCM